MKQADQSAQSRVVRTFIDNRPGNTLLEAVRRLMGESSYLDLATGYLELGAFIALDGAWQSLQEIRLLMGDEVTRSTKAMIVAALQRKDTNGIELAKEEDDWRALEGLAAIEAALRSGQIYARAYTKAKFHAKAMHFRTGGVVNHGIVGSSNFTRKGLTQNLELNLFTSDHAQLRELDAWFEQAWKEAEDVRPELLKIIEPHVREYLPFEIYLQAMRERFFGIEPGEATWEKTESRIYPELAQYQVDAYHDLTHMAETWGGGLLCDGVGLGKTFVGLMLIERARLDRHKVLVIAPKAAIPSVWERYLNKYFPDDFGRYTDDIRVLAHTDLGRDGGVTWEEVEKLRSRYDTIIVDEAHHFRVPSRNRSQKLKKLVKGKRLFLLTATPINNSLLDLYYLLNYIAQDDQRKFQSVNVPHLRNFFGGEQSNDREYRGSLFDIENPALQEFLRHVLVARTRRYVKSLDRQEDPSVKFPTRERPIVIRYSLSETYGELFPKLLRAFDTHLGQLKLVIYETEKFKETKEKDEKALNEQSQVVALIRTMLLKRLESSQVALEASLEDLLLKHIQLLKDLNPLKYENWLAENRELFDVLQEHKRVRYAKSNVGDQGEAEEEDDLPLTTYEAKKIAQVRKDLGEFGKNEQMWLESLERDMGVLTTLLRDLHEVTSPENDAKLRAFLETIESDSRLRTEKIVIFSEFKDTARYLERELNKRFQADAIIEVDSDRNVANREQVIKRFAPYYNCENDSQLGMALKDPIRVLISTDVLSEGLNLQDANVIVNYDLHWNPVRLMQRIGRVDRRMDPSKPVDYDKVYVYNFLPPDDLEQVLRLYETITGKLIAINRALGIEAPVLTAEDDFKAMDFYQNLGEGTLTVEEQLRLKSHQLAKEHPELWQHTLDYPNRIYSGKAAVEGKSKATEEQGAEPTGSGRYLFLCYRIVTGYDKDNPDAEPTRDAKWVMIDRDTGEITEDLVKIHEAIECAEGTPRKVEVPKQERSKLRARVEGDLIEQIRFRSQIPVDYKDELVCWMEVG